MCFRVENASQSAPTEIFAGRKSGFFRVFLMGFFGNGRDWRFCWRRGVMWQWKCICLVFFIDLSTYSGFWCICLTFLWIWGLELPHFLMHVFYLGRKNVCFLKNWVFGGYLTFCQLFCNKISSWSCIIFCQLFFNFFNFFNFSIAPILSIFSIFHVFGVTSRAWKWFFW